MAKTEKQPVMLGSLVAGAWFKFDNKIWELKNHNPTVERSVSEGTANCRQINSSVIKDICRSNYVLPV